MAIVPFSSLIRSVSREEVIEDLTILGDWLGLKASSWRTFSVARWALLCAAEIGSRVSVQIALLAANGVNATAYGNGLTKLSKGTFNVDRIGAVATQGRLVLTDAAGTGAHNIAVGAFVFKDEDNGYTYRNTTGGTLPLSGTLAVTIEAEVGGGAQNVANGKITIMNPTIAGVTCTNPANPTTWITRNGVDEESDDSLKVRNPNVFNTLGGNAPAGAYEYWALSATDGSGNPVGITRVAINDQNPAGSCSLTVYVANDAGVATSTQVTNIQNYINARKPRTAIPTVVAATAKPITVLGSFHVTAGLGAQRKTEIEAAVVDYINSLPIGGEDIGETLGRLIWSELVEAAMGFDGVKRVEVTTPAADVVLQPFEIATVAVVTFTYTEV